MSLYKNNFAETTYPFRLISANVTDEGWSIVRASEVGGHRTVKTFDDLFELTIPVLSESTYHNESDGGGALVDSTATPGADAIGQLWYVQDEACFYQLIDWEDRKTSAGWKKFTAGGGAQLVLPIDGVFDTNLTLGGLINGNESNSNKAEDMELTGTTPSGETISIGKIDRSRFGIYFYQNPHTTETGTIPPSHATIPYSRFILGSIAMASDDNSSAGTPPPSADPSTTNNPANRDYQNNKDYFYFTNFIHSELYAYNGDVEQIFLEPTGQAWKYNETGTNLIPTDFVSAFTTKQDVQLIVNDRVAELIDGAPENFDTLKELADAIKSFEGEGGTLEAFVPKTRTITTDGGLTGGGDLMSDRTISIADGGVTTAKIANSGVTTAKIANSNVTSDKIADGAVTSAKIFGNSVTEVKIANGAVTSAKISNEAVTINKIEDDTLSMLAGDALRFYGVGNFSAESQNNKPILYNNSGVVMQYVDGWDIFFDESQGKFAYAYITAVTNTASNDSSGTATTPPADSGDSSGSPSSSGEPSNPEGESGSLVASNNTPDTLDDNTECQSTAYTLFKFNDNVKNILYKYEQNVSKLFLDKDGVYWTWNSNGTGLVKSDISTTKESVGDLDAKVAKLNGDVYAVQRALPGTTVNQKTSIFRITGSYVIKNADNTESAKASLTGNLQLKGGQEAILSNLHYEWSISNTTDWQPFTLRTAGLWSAAGEYNVNPSATSFNTDTAGIAAKTAVLTPTNTNVSITLGAPKVGLMVSNNKVVPATGSDTSTKTISASWTYARYWGTISSIPSSATAWASTIMDNVKNASTNADQNKGTSEYVAANTKGKTMTVKNNFATGNCHFFYAYPKSWGALSKAILDGATPVFNTFERTEATITTAEGYSVSYYIYYTPGTGGYTGGSVAFS